MQYLGEVETFIIVCSKYI